MNGKSGLYERLGYRIYQRKEIPGSFAVVFMEKLITFLSTYKAAILALLPGDHEHIPPHKDAETLLVALDLLEPFTAFRLLAT